MTDLEKDLLFQATAAQKLWYACNNAVNALMLLPPSCLDEVDFPLSRDELINEMFSAIAWARPE